MKNRNYKKNYLFYILIVFTILCTGCTSVISSPFPLGGPTSGIIVIESGANTTFDRTPALALYSDGTDYMSFSGDGESWSEWIAYNSSYEDFNMVNNQNGTQFISGMKTIYVRFKDENEKLSSSKDLAYDTIDFEFKKLNSIKIMPSEIIMTVGSSNTFEVTGYDIDSNEIPLDGSQIIWEKTCGVGSLSDISGLATTYTAPTVTGDKNIMASFGPLRAGSKIIVVSE